MFHNVDTAKPRGNIKLVAINEMTLNFRVQAWCARRKLVLFILALNIALAVTFYKLLYENK